VKEKAKRTVSVAVMSALTLIALIALDISLFASINGMNESRCITIVGAEQKFPEFEPRIDSQKQETGETSLRR
jgi:hypothetical protein